MVIKSKETFKRETALGVVREGLLEEEACRQRSEGCGEAVLVSWGGTGGQG